MKSSLLRSGRGLAVATLVAAVALPATAQAAGADSGLTVSTPYPSVAAEPGSTVKFDVSVADASAEVVGLAVDAVPDGWHTTLRGGGFVIQSVMPTPAKPATVTLELALPPDVAAGSYPLQLDATGPTGAHVTLPVDVVVQDTVDAGIGVTADFPSLRGDPATTFTYTLTITNNTPESETFTFDPTAPQGWTVSASPTAEAKAETVTIDAGGTGDVKVSATPPATVAEGTYPIQVQVTSAAGAKGSIALEAEVTGTPKLALATADQRLNTSGRSNHTKRLAMVVANSGTAPLEDVKLAATAPTGWEVSFEPAEVAEVKPNETAQVVAVIKPGKNAVAGDYAIAVRASAGADSSNVDLRFGVKGSTWLGVVGIGLIVAAFAALAGMFVKFGRR